MNIERVYFKEAIYVGTENYGSLPPVQDMDPARRVAWTITEDVVGVRVQHKSPNGWVGHALVPWSNVKGVNYEVQHAPAPSTPTGGGKR